MKNVHNSLRNGQNSLALFVRSFFGWFFFGGGVSVFFTFLIVGSIFSENSFYNFLEFPKKNKLIFFKKSIKF